MKNRVAKKHAHQFITGKLAGRRGWGGCHWDAPTLLGFVDETGELCPPVGGWGAEKLPIAAKVFKREGLL